METVKIDQLTPDDFNANAGTERGMQMLDDSLRLAGAGRSILLDKNLKIIAGNKTVDRAADIGLEDVILVHSDGKKLVAVVRDDLDLDSTSDDRARRLALADNRVSQVDLEWDAEIMAALAQDQPELLKGLWSDDEIEDLLKMAAPPPTLDDLEDKYGEPDAQDMWPVIKIRISPETMVMYQETMARMEGKDEPEKFAAMVELARTASGAGIE